jgi:hypothetical protein
MSSAPPTYFNNRLDEDIHKIALIYGALLDEGI